MGRCSVRETWVQQKWCLKSLLSSFLQTLMAYPQRGGYGSTYTLLSFSLTVVPYSTVGLTRYKDPARRASYTKRNKVWKSLCLAPRSRNSISGHKHKPKSCKLCFGWKFTLLGTNKFCMKFVRNVGVIFSLLELFRTRIFISYCSQGCNPIA